MKTNTEKTALRVIAPDGEYKTEGHFPSVEDAWSRASDMGSRWFFYPICLVTGPAQSDKARILDVPHGMPREWIGRTLKTLCKALAGDSQHACDYVNGKCPLMLYPA